MVMQTVNDYLLNHPFIILFESHGEIGMKVKECYAKNSILDINSEIS
uniref:Uncharacterized protein n=1 Tax=Bartonella schoenbuchensis (strain DSM 13525 / NCTC 13165 / R1) TaxID=687861 RepID=E6YZV2_BARSR|nr:hypothetical protein B11C_40245 [Bartonella schoenbuchensis R1]